MEHTLCRDRKGRRPGPYLPHTALGLDPTGCLQPEGSRRAVFGRIFSWYWKSDVHTREEAAMAKIRVYTTPT